MIREINNISENYIEFENLRNKYAELKDNSILKNEDSKKVESKKIDDSNIDSFEQSLDIDNLSNALQSAIADPALQASFKVDEDTNKLILRMLEKESGEIVRQYPPDVSLQIARIVNKLLEDGKIDDANI